MGDHDFLRSLLAEAAHAMEMYRRQAANEKESRTLARLVNRIARISKELQLIEGSKK